MKKKDLNEYVYTKLNMGKKIDLFFQLMSPLQVLYICWSYNRMSRDIYSGEKSDETGAKVNSSLSCENCGPTFNSRQELKEHSSSIH